MATADTLIINGKVITLDKDSSIHQALAIKDGWIMDVGTNEEIYQHQGENTEVIDLQGKVVLPGVHDSHMHAAHTGLFLAPDMLNLKFPEVTSIADMRELLAKEVAKREPGQWIFGFGWNGGVLKETVAENRTPVKQDFDDISPDNPIAFYDYSAHALVVNSKALEIAGIDKDTPDLKEEEGFFARDEDGQPNGYFFEWGALILIGQHMPQLSDKEIEEAILRMQHFLNSHGITSHADIVGIGGRYLYQGTWSDRVIPIYEKLAREGRLTARVSVNIMAGLEGVQGYDAIIQGIEQTELPEFQDKNWVKADIIKFFADGQPAPGDNYVFKGETVEEKKEELQKTIKEVHRRGWQMGVHSTGNVSAGAIIDGFIQAQQAYPGPSPRHFLIHGDWMTIQRAQRAKKYDIGLSAQPNAGFNVMDFLVDMFGEAGEGVFCLQSLAEAGINVSGSSDSNIFDPNWRLGVQFAVTRKTINGNTYRPELASTVENAIRVYTFNGAYQEHREQILGTIEPDKLADLQVLGQDILTVNPEEIGEIPVVMTLTNGKVVYTA